MLTAELDTTQAFVKLDALPRDVKAALAAETRTLGAAIAGLARAKASGQVLHPVTGAFAESITDTEHVTRNGVYGKVDSSDPRAAIFERGGTTGAHDILPTSRQALAFMMSSGEVFAKIVHHPGSHIHPHSVIRAAFAELEGEVRSGLREAAAGAISNFS